MLVVKRLQIVVVKLLKPVFDVPNVGRFGIIEDTTGVCFGFMEPVSQSVECDEEIK